MTPYTKDGLYGGSSIIPAVILNKNVTLTNDSGDGTKTKPYKVS